jgi:digeranylgeranylglycerophospholipid reductase
MEELDVLVVGAGPAGTTVAHRLATRGHRVLVVEEHPRVGYPVQCAGLVSQRALDLAGSRSFVRIPVRGASVFGPSLEAVHFKAPEPRAFVIDRGALDVALADRAANAGAEFRTSTRFDARVRSENGRTVVRLTGPDATPVELAARLVIGARSPGHSVSVDRSRSFPRSKPRSPAARATRTRSKCTLGT